MSARGVAMSTNNHAALRSIKARVTPMIMGTAATGSRVALSRWARPSKAARHAAPPTAVASEVKPILSWNSSSSKPKPSVEAVADATSPPSADSEPDHLAHAKPIDFDMASKIEGQESQMVSFELEPGQVIRAEAGNLVFMEDGIEMDTSTGGGASSMFRRVITGQNMFVTDYVNKGDWNSKVGLGTDVPSKIIRLSLAAYGGEIICQRGAFLAGSHTIDIQTEFTKMMAGFFGGEGFVLQRLTGEGDAFVKASGPLIQRELMEGESLRVSSGSVVAFAPTVEYDVQTIPGFKNVVFGGEGLFITNLTGPGMVFLQGLPFDRMVDQIARRIPGNRGAGGLPFGLGGMGGGGGGGGGEGGEGVAATAAETGEESGMHASGDGGASAESASGFGDAAVRSASSASSGNFEESDHGFSKPPPEGSAGETTWGEGEATDGASDGGGVGEEGGGDLGEGEGDEGDGSSGVRGVLSRMFAPREDADDDWDDWDTGDWD